MSAQCLPGVLAGEGGGCEHPHDHLERGAAGGAPGGEAAELCSLPPPTLSPGVSHMVPGLLGMAAFLYMLSLNIFLGGIGGV